jgi:hypothetical protein
VLSEGAGVVVGFGYGGCGSGEGAVRVGDNAEAAVNDVGDTQGELPAVVCLCPSRKVNAA